MDKELEEQFYTLGKCHNRDFIDLCKLDIPDQQFYTKLAKLSDRQMKQLSTLHDTAMEKMKHIAPRRVNLIMKRVLAEYERLMYD